MGKKNEEILCMLSGGVFLDPETVGSSIRHRIKVFKNAGARYFDYEIDLTDCKHSIRWHGYGAKDIEPSLRKIRRAIETLLVIESSLTEAKRVYELNAPKPRIKK